MTKSRGINRQYKRWTSDEAQKLKLLYPSSSTDELATLFGCTTWQIYAKASRMGLHKSPEYLASSLTAAGENLQAYGAAHRYSKGHVPANKGLRRPGWSSGRMAETQFKKGQATKWYPIGSERLVDGYRYTKVSDIRNVPWTRNWRPTHVLLWEKETGPLPAGHALAFRNGDRNDIRLENLELISRRELMARNTVHHLPKELVQVVQLRGALVRQINRRSKAEGATA